MLFLDISNGIVQGNTSWGLELTKKLEICHFAYSTEAIFPCPHCSVKGPWWKGSSSFSLGLSMSLVQVTQLRNNWEPCGQLHCPKLKLGLSLLILQWESHSSSFAQAMSWWLLPWLRDNTVCGSGYWSIESAWQGQVHGGFKFLHSYARIFPHIYFFVLFCFCGAILITKLFLNYF